MSTVLAFIRRNGRRFEFWLEGVDREAVNPDALIRLLDECYDDPSTFFFREFPEHARLSDQLSASDIIDTKRDVAPQMGAPRRRRCVEALESPPLRGRAQRDVCRGLGMLLFSNRVEEFVDEILRPDGELNISSLRRALRAFDIEVSRGTIQGAIRNLRRCRAMFPAAENGVADGVSTAMKRIEDRLQHEIEALIAAAERLGESPQNSGARDEAGHCALSVARTTNWVLLEGRYLGEHIADTPDFAAAEKATLNLLRASCTGDPAWDPVGELAVALSQHEKGHPFATAVAAARGALALLGRGRLGGELALLQLLVLARYLLTFDEFVELNEELCDRLDALDQEQAAEDARRWRIPTAMSVKAGIIANIVSHGCTSIATDNCDDAQDMYAKTTVALNRLRELREETKDYLVFHEAQHAGIAAHLGDAETSTGFWRRFDCEGASRVVASVLELEDSPELADLVVRSAQAVHPRVMELVKPDE
ncbi:MAG: hypothetical protein KAS72_07715 [Phycisphaerales bacterium]|nr:hypothetical protein [Phycisphaerales bacterium]